MKLKTKFKIITVMLLFMAGLAAATLIWIPRHQGVFRPPGPGLLIQDPEKGISLRPGVENLRRIATRGPRSSLSAPPVVIQDRLEEQRTIPFFVSTNSLGFRSSNLSSEPAPGATRIACVGDSITYGWGVDNGEEYCSLLAKSLPGKIEIINAGIPGQSSSQALRYMQAKVLPLKPHIVIISSGINDLAFLRHLNQSEVSPGEINNLDGKLDEMLGQFESNLRSMVGILRQQKIKPVLMLPPTSSFFEYEAIVRINAVTHQLGKSEGVPVVDLNELMRLEEKNNGVLLARDGASQKIIRYKDSRPTLLMSARSEHVKGFGCLIPPNSPTLIPVNFPGRSCEIGIWSVSQGLGRQWGAGLRV